MKGYIARAAGLLFGIMVAHGLLETARDALFLVELGAERLAWAYLAIAGVAMIALAGMRRLRDRDPRRMLVGLTSIGAIGTGALAATLPLSSSLVFVLYLWSGLIATLVVPAVWTVIDRGVHVGQAKRVFALIGAGGVLGALVGSALAALIARGEILVWFAAGVLAVMAMFATTIPVLPPRERADRRPRRTHQNTRRYARLLLVAALLGTAALTLGDLMFKRMLAAQFAGPDLAGAFGASYTALNVLGLAVQLAVTPRLLDRVGVGGALLVLPAIAVASALGFAVTGAAIAIAAFKLGDGSLRHSVHRVANEILFLPLAPAARETDKPVIEALGHRGGQAIAAVASLALATWVPLLAVGVAIAWAIALVAVRVAYVQQFRDTLDADDIQRDVRIPTLDPRAIALFTEALSSPDESEAMAALDLLARRSERIPALVLYHPSPAIVRRALALLDGEVRDDVQRVLRHLTTHADPRIRAAALAAASRTSLHADRLLAALRDPEPEVRAVAAVAQPERAEQVLLQLAEGTQAERIALARAIARSPHARFRPLLDALFVPFSPAVAREVVGVWERTLELVDVRKAIELLACPHVRTHVRRVFVAAGSRYFDDLLAALDDPRTPLAVRRHLPRTISRFAGAPAVTALVARLAREPDSTTELKILRALGRMRTQQPDLPIDGHVLRGYVLRAIEDAARYQEHARELSALERTPDLEMLLELVVDDRRHAIERGFRVLGILYPRSDLRSVHDAITSDDAERRAAAREILEHLVPATIRIPLFAALQPSSRRGMRDLETLLGALLADPDEAVRCIAAHHVAERNLVALRPELTRLRPYMPPIVGQAFDQALARLHA
jgi:AAA family ATP:ADP antiporter